MNRFKTLACRRWGDTVLLSRSIHFERTSEIKNSLAHLRVVPLLRLATQGHQRVLRFAPLFAPYHFSVLFHCSNSGLNVEPDWG